VRGKGLVEGGGVAWGCCCCCCCGCCWKGRALRPSSVRGMFDVLAVGVVAVALGVGTWCVGFVGVGAQVSVRVVRSYRRQSRRHCKIGGIIKRRLSKSAY